LESTTQQELLLNMVLIRTDDVAKLRKQLRAPTARSVRATSRRGPNSKRAKPKASEN
jgi:hypothetical protein